MTDKKKAPRSRTTKADSKKASAKSAKSAKSSPTSQAPVRNVEILPDSSEGAIDSRSPLKAPTSLVPATAVPVEGLVGTDPLALYLAEIRRYPLLSPEEEHELAVQYREQGDREAAEKLVTSNLRFVVKIAAEYSKFGAKMIDLIQEGNVGLMQAVKEFNPHHGTRLITYAVWWIRGYIREFLMRQYSLVRLGTTHNQKKLFYNLQQEEQRLDALGKELDPAKLSAKLGVTEEEIAMMKSRMSGRDVSLDQPLDDESRASLMDLQKDEFAETPEDQLVRHEQIENLKNLINKIRPELNSKELYILENRVLADEPLTLQEIGDHMGITRERTRQIEARMLGRIKELLVAAGEVS